MDFFWIILLVFVLVDIFLLVCVLYYRRRRRSFDRAFFSQQWRRILLEKDLSKAVMEADKLLDIVLKRMGYRGTLGEKLRKGGKLFHHIDDVWFAHKLRNRIAHELDHRPSVGELKRALKIFEQAFSDLGLS